MRRVRHEEERKMEEEEGEREEVKRRGKKSCRRRRDVRRVSSSGCLRFGDFRLLFVIDFEGGQKPLFPLDFNHNLLAASHSCASSFSTYYPCHLLAMDRCGKSYLTCPGSVKTKKRREDCIGDVSFTVSL